MHIEAVRDWLTVVFTGLGIGGLLFGATWRFIVKPQLELNIMLPLAQVEAKVDGVIKELHPNGGTSLRDRVDDTQRTAANAVQTAAAAERSSADNGRLLAQQIETIDHHIEQSDGDRIVLRSLEAKVNDLNNQMVRQKT